jgi:hypothetical protein
MVTKKPSAPPRVTFKQLDDVFSAAREMCGAGDPVEYDDAVAEVDAWKTRLYRELRRLRRLEKDVQETREAFARGGRPKTAAKPKRK